MSSDNDDIFSEFLNWAEGQEGNMPSGSAAMSPISGTDQDEDIVEGEEYEEAADEIEEFESETDTPEEDGLYDPQEESLLYSGEDRNSVLYDELNSDERDDESFVPDGDLEENRKRSFAEVNNEKKPFMAGRLNKTVLLSVIGGIFILVLLIFNLANMKRKAELDKNEKKEMTVSVGGYKPDFGDYKSRQYVPTKEEEDLQELSEVEKYFQSDNKEEFIPDQTPVTPPYQETYSSGTGNTYVAATDPVAQAEKSDIRFKGEGFGFSSQGAVPVMSPDIQQPDNGGMPYNLSDDQIAQKYMDRLGTVNNALGNGSGGGQEKDDGRWSNAGAYNPSAKGGDITSIPEFSVYPGTVIDAVLVNGINTDYPGTITARVTSNVFDSSTGKHLLIPAGSILRGSYSSSAIGVSRVQIAWQTMILNRDGLDYYVNLGSMVGVDQNGYSGIKGSLNEHTFQYLKAAGISALFTCINSNIFAMTNKMEKRPVAREMIEDSQEIGNRLADKIMDRALDIQPTVKVRPGTRISVDVDRILTLIPYDVDVPKEKYIRR